MLSVIRRGCLAAAACTAAAMPLLTPVSADAQVAKANARVPIQGMLDHPIERVNFAGQLSIETRIVQDAVFLNPDVLELTIDFSTIRGIGLGSRAAFGTEALVIVRRPLKAFDEFEVTFPYGPGNNPRTARTGVVSLQVVTNPARQVTVRATPVRNP
ncbi:MAG TPA: hypothetical protein VF522_01630 [Ramlibacter sp.]|uniref:hypothetical protein n=1 Tax=Ramlibacter sp. TaxID=1917967 RepID=UPI002ECFBBF1